MSIKIVDAGGKMTPQEKWNRAHPEYYIQWRAAHPNRNQKWDQARKDLIINEKQKPCVDCGMKYKPYQMDFDHIKGQKLFNIGMAKVSLKRLKDEISKCDVVCANCHRQRTYERGYVTKN